MANLTISLDDTDKKELSEFCNEVGISVSGLFTMFTKKVLNDWAIPFTVGMPKPNRTTIAALKEGERIARDPNAKGYTNLDEMWADLDKEDSAAE